MFGGTINRTNIFKLIQCIGYEAESGSSTLVKLKREVEVSLDEVGDVVEIDYKYSEKLIPVFKNELDISEANIKSEEIINNCNLTVILDPSIEIDMTLRDHPQNIAQYINNSDLLEIVDRSLFNNRAMNTEFRCFIYPTNNLFFNAECRNDNIFFDTFNIFIKKINNYFSNPRYIDTPDEYDKISESKYKECKPYYITTYFDKDTSKKYENVEVKKLQFMIDKYLSSKINKGNKPNEWTDIYYWAHILPYKKWTWKFQSTVQCFLGDSFSIISWLNNDVIYKKPSYFFGSLYLYYIVIFEILFNYCIERLNEDIDIIFESIDYIFHILMWTTLFNNRKEDIMYLLRNDLKIIYINMNIESQKLVIHIINKFYNLFNNICCSDQNITIKKFFMWYILELSPEYRPKLTIHLQDSPKFNKSFNLKLINLNNKKKLIIHFEIRNFSNMINKIIPNSTLELYNLRQIDQFNEPITQDNSTDFIQKTKLKLQLNRDNKYIKDVYKDIQDDKKLTDYYEELLCTLLENKGPDIYKSNIMKNSYINSEQYLCDLEILNEQCVEEGETKWNLDTLKELRELQTEITNVGQSVPNFKSRAGEKLSNSIFHHVY